MSHLLGVKRDFLENVQTLDHLLKQVNANGFNKTLLSVIEENLDKAETNARQIKSLRNKRVYPPAYKAGRLL